MITVKEIKELFRQELKFKYQSFPYVFGFILILCAVFFYINEPVESNSSFGPLCILILCSLFSGSSILQNVKSNQKGNSFSWAYLLSIKADKAKFIQSTQIIGFIFKLPFILQLQYILVSVFKDPLINTDYTIILLILVSFLIDSQAIFTGVKSFKTSLISGGSLSLKRRVYIFSLNFLTTFKIIFIGAFLYILIKWLLIYNLDLGYLVILLTLIVCNFISYNHALRICRNLYPLDKSFISECLKFLGAFILAAAIGIFSSI